MKYFPAFVKFTFSYFLYQKFTLFPLIVILGEKKCKIFL